MNHSEVPSDGKGPQDEEDQEMQIEENGGEKKTTSEALFASAGCMQSIVEFMPYGEVWKLNALNKRFYNQIVPLIMTNLGIYPRISSVDLFDGLAYMFSFSRK